MIIQRESVINYHEISVLENKSFINWTNLCSTNNYIMQYTVTTALQGFRNGE